MPPVDFSAEVFCFWELETDSAVPLDLPYKIVPDGTTDLIFSLNKGDFSPAFLSITTSAFQEIPLGPNVHLFGIRFFPGVISRIFSFSLSGLSGQNPDAQDWMGKGIQEWEFRFYEAKTSQSVIALALNFLNSVFKNLSIQDHRFTQSLYLMFQSSGTARVEKELADWMSSRQMRRIFEEKTGLSPKMLSQVIRFQKVLNALPLHSSKEPFWLDFGYFDQAHFIKEFKRFTGTTPGRHTFSAS